MSVFGWLNDNNATKWPILHAKTSPSIFSKYRIAFKRLSWKKMRVECEVYVRLHKRYKYVENTYKIRRQLIGTGEAEPALNYHNEVHNEGQLTF